MSPKNFWDLKVFEVTNDVTSCLESVQIVINWLFLAFLKHFYFPHARKDGDAETERKRWEGKRHQTEKSEGALINLQPIWIISDAPAQEALKEGKLWKGGRKKEGEERKQKRSDSLMIEPLMDVPLCQFAPTDREHKALCVNALFVEEEEKEGVMIYSHSLMAP